jgi:hypothetical protein
MAPRQQLDCWWSGLNFGPVWLLCFLWAIRQSISQINVCLLIKPKIKPDFVHNHRLTRRPLTGLVPPPTPTHHRQQGITPASPHMPPQQSSTYLLIITSLLLRHSGSPSSPPPLQPARSRSAKVKKDTLTTPPLHREGASCRPLIPPPPTSSPLHPLDCPGREW